MAAYKPVDYFTPNAGRAGVLSPDDFSYFEQQRRRIRNQYLQGTQQAKYQGSLLDAENSRSKRDLTRQFGEIRNQLPGQFAGGGVLNSGIYQKALTDYATDRSTGFADLSARYLEQKQGLSQSLGQLSSIYKSSLDDVASSEAARRATAEAIRIAQGGI